MYPSIKMRLCTPYGVEVTEINTERKAACSRFYPACSGVAPRLRLAPAALLRYAHAGLGTTRRVAVGIADSGGAIQRPRGTKAEVGIEAETQSEPCSLADTRGVVPVIVTDIHAVTFR